MYEKYVYHDLYALNCIIIYFRPACNFEKSFFMKYKNILILQYKKGLYGNISFYTLVLLCFRVYLWPCAYFL